MMEWSLDHFLVRALMGGLLIAVTAAPIGCFIVWRRMAYFGETLSHSALLGLALGFLLGIQPVLGVLAVGVAAGGVLIAMQRRRQLATDTLLGIIAHGSLALGLVVLSSQETLRIDLFAYLFGDILTVGKQDLAVIALGSLVSLGVLLFLWRPLLLMTISEELAAVEGVNRTLVTLLFTFLVALTVALSMKAVGILLVTSLLIIPSAAARKLSRTPEMMVVGAVIFAALSICGGLGAGLLWDLAAGPSIVVVATALFAVTYLVPGRV